MVEQHREYMQRALDLAKKAEGHTSPNPMVGAVIVKDGRIIGEGYHKKAGGPHAEVEAIRSLVASSQGATMYVSLEPCCIYGKTPPCSKAVIEAGITEVYYAAPDTNPKVDGGGHRQLEEAGVRVHCGPLEKEAVFLNRAFFHYITQKQTYVIAKYAMSLDGKIATQTADSQWITGEDARAYGHWLRHCSDGILVGAQTVIHDNPRLTTRREDVGAIHPTRVILDSTGRTPISAKVYNPELPGKTIFVTTERCEDQFLRALEQRGVETLVIKANQQGQVPLPLLLKHLAEKDMVQLMVEGGGQVLGSFLTEGLIDEVWAFIGGKIIGGQHAPGPFHHGFDKISETLALDIYHTSCFEKDILIKAIPQKHKFVS